MTEREFAVDIVRKLRGAGHEALWAGGCVRDQLLGREPHDYDVATDAEPDAVRKLFPRTIAVGVSFGVVEVLGPKPLKVQVATFRTDGLYIDGRRPETVTFATAREDAERRDFTINGMFFDPLADRVIDHVGGEADLRDRVLRAIGDPAARFAEDKLRLLRAARFAARFGLTMDPATAAAARAMAAEIAVVSAERIAEELRKMLTDPTRAVGHRLLIDLALAARVLPEADSGEVLAKLPAEASFPLALASLIRPVGEKAAGKACERLRLSNEEKGRVVWLIDRVAQVGRAPLMRASELKPLLAHPGIGELLTLASAVGDAESVAHCVARLAEWPAEVLDPEPLVTGDDLKALGVPPGPKYKTLLEAARAAQLDGEVATREEAVGLVGRMR